MLSSVETTRDLSPPKCHIYLRQIFRLGFAVSSQLTSDVGLVCGFCTSPGGAWREDVRGTKPGVFVHLRRLPSYGLLPHRSCPRLVHSSLSFTFWYNDFQ